MKALVKAKPEPGLWLQDVPEPACGLLIDSFMFTRRLLLLCVAAALTARGELTVPAFTAYLEPNPKGASVAEKSGVTGWHDPAVKVCWFGEIKTPGKLDCALSLRLPANVVSKLRMTVAGQSHEATAKGEGDKAVLVRFDPFEIAKFGYQKLALESLNPAGQSAGDLDALLLDGPAAQDAHFNLKPRRNAASVHLRYPTPNEPNISAFYCEVTAVEDPVATYYMAAGWNRGYFGMQVNGVTERRIIFSVWDAGGEVKDRGKVADQDRATLLAKGEGVVTGDFGNEGTGGHSLSSTRGRRARRSVSSPPRSPWMRRTRSIRATIFTRRKSNGC